MIASLLVGVLMYLSPTVVPQVAAANLPSSTVAAVARTANCTDHTFFGVPTWYEYLDMQEQNINGDTSCDIAFSNYQLQDGSTGKFNGKIVLLIGLAVTDILLHLGALVAVGFVVFGGFKFTTSQGEPQGAKEGRQTIINALVGLVITIVASAIVSFIGNSLG